MECSAAKDLALPKARAQAKRETIRIPLCTEDFIKGLERILGRKIDRRSSGRKPNRRDKDLLGQMSLLE